MEVKKRKPLVTQGVCVFLLPVIHFMLTGLPRMILNKKGKVPYIPIMN